MRREFFSLLSARDEPAYRGWRSAENQGPGMTDSPDETRRTSVHRLDTRQADLGAGLRRLFDPIIDEPVPEELTRLSEELEQRLTGGPSMPDSTPAEPSPPVVPKRD